MSALASAAKIVKKSFWSALHLLYPPVCPFCNSSLVEDERESESPRFICNSCLDSIERIAEPVCVCCGDPLDDPDLDLCDLCGFLDVPFVEARSYGLYDGVLARSIQLLKYERERALVKDLAPLLAHVFYENPWHKELEMISFVPMQKRSQRLRGFNQSELLARELGKLIDIPVIPALRKIKKTRPQMELSGSERRENLSGAFEALPDLAAHKLLLIDDVYTTGTTVSECSQVLRESGVAEICVLTLARAPLIDKLEPEDMARGD